MFHQVSHQEIHYVIITEEGVLIMNGALQVLMMIKIK